MKRYVVRFSCDCDGRDPCNFPPNAQIRAWWKHEEIGPEGVMCVVVDALSKKDAMDVVVKDWPTALEWGVTEEISVNEKYIEGPKRQWMFPVDPGSWMEERLKTLFDTNPEPVKPVLHYAKQVTIHRDGGFNDLIDIRASGDMSPGGAYFVYDVTWKNGEVTHHTPIRFQNGDPANGITGMSNEALIAIVHHRLTGFQQGPFPSAYNAEAIVHLENALTCLRSRACERAERGVSGKQEE